MIELRFTKPWQNYTSPLTLRFGDDDGTEPVPLPIPYGLIGIESAAVWITAPKREQQLLLLAKSNKIGIKQAISWNTPAAAGQQTCANWNSSPVDFQSYSNINWIVPVIRANSIAITWASPDLHSITNAITWQVPQQQQTEFSYPWVTNPNAFEHKRDINWIDSELIQQRIISRFNSFQYRINDHSIKWGPHKPEWICSTRYRPPENGKVKIRFSEPFNTSTSPIQLRFTPSPTYCYFDDGGGLVDSNPILPPIDFKLPIVPQIRRSYIMQPQIECIRVSDDAVIVLKSVSIQSSRTQWTSSINISFSSRIDAERAKGELLKIGINGYDFFMLCEQHSMSKAFGTTSYSATGRGRVAELSNPHKKAVNYVNTQPRSFIGLMSDIVEYTDWQVSSDITDFTVPANAFSYADKTPAEALHMMANAIGAMLDINDDTQVINVIPQWPTSPWSLADTTPDVVLHDNVILEYSEQTIVNPPANAVFVRGEQQGVSATIKRTGTAGDEFADDVVDKLITDNQAARMRGTAELSHAGNKLQTSIRTKIMPDLPPIRKGMVIGITKDGIIYKAVCDSVSITAAVSGQGKVTVNQSITLLRNEATA